MADRTTFSRQEILQANSRHDLVALIGKRVTLTRTGNEWRGLCPFHDETTPSFYVTPETGLYRCQSCGASGDALAWLTQKEGMTFKQAVETSLQRTIPRPVRQLQAIRSLLSGLRPASSDVAARQRKKETARLIWSEGVPLAGTLGERFLYIIGIVLEKPLSNFLRYHPSVLHEPTGEYFPAIVALVRDAKGNFVGVYRTYLAPDGCSIAKVRKDSPRRMLGECHGCYARLSQGVPKKLLIAETLETALTFMQACPDLDVWVSMSLGNMKTPVPREVSDIILCADGNAENPPSADRILKDAVRLHQEQEHVVYVARPPRGMDFNDMLLAE